MTLLMEGKESRAHSMMEEFQFTGDTPALYYAQAAWEYKHNNAQKAEDWTNSANKIYSPALNGVFADAFYDVGWLQRPEGTAAPAVAFDAGNVGAAQTDGGPAVEPSPIPDKRGGSLALAPSTNAPDAGMELAGTGATANQTSLTGPAPETNAPVEQSAAQSPTTSGESTTASQPAAAETASGESTTASQAIAAETASASTVASSQNQAEQQPVAQTSPPQEESAGTAPAKASSSTIAGASGRRLWIVGGLLLAAVVLLAVAILPALRRYKFTVPAPSQPELRSDTAVFKARTAPAHTTAVPGNGFAGGPRQVSLQLKPWNSPPARGSALPSPKAGGALNRLKSSKPKPSRLPSPIEPEREESAPVDEPFVESVGQVLTAAEPQRETSAPVAQPFFESVGPVLEQGPDVEPAVASQETGLDGSEPATEFADASTTMARSVDSEILEVPEESVFATQQADEFSKHPTEEPLVAYEQPNEIFASGDEYAWRDTEAAAESTAVPIENDQPRETIFAEHEICYCAAFAQKLRITDYVKFCPVAVISFD